MGRAAFKPDWASPPGDTIADILSERRITETELAERVGETVDELARLIKGNRLLTIQVARKLENVLGGSAAFWMIREAQYREALDRIRYEALSTNTTWLKCFPLSEMSKLGWMKHHRKLTDQFSECLKFFNVSNVEDWQNTYLKLLNTTAFRISPSFSSQAGALTAWMRQAEIQSESVHCRVWDRDRFRTTLDRIRPLTREKDPDKFINHMTQLCADCGVAVVIVRSPRGCRASGATRFIHKEKALLALSCRFLSDDQFWFSFFHEAGHLLLHSENSVFIDGRLKNVPPKAEREANQFAADVLIPDQYKPALNTLRLSAYNIARFAKEVGVSAGIVVGQLQHQGRLQNNHFNALKRRYSWTCD